MHGLQQQSRKAQQQDREQWRSTIAAAARARMGESRAVRSGSANTSQRRRGTTARMPRTRVRQPTQVARTQQQGQGMKTSLAISPPRGGGRHGSESRCIDRLWYRRRASGRGRGARRRMRPRRRPGGGGSGCTWKAPGGEPGRSGIPYELDKYRCEGRSHHTRTMGSRTMRYENGHPPHTTCIHTHT